MKQNTYKYKINLPTPINVLVTTWDMDRAAEIVREHYPSESFEFMGIQTELEKLSQRSWKRF